MPRLAFPRLSACQVGDQASLLDPVMETYDSNGCSADHQAHQAERAVRISASITERFRLDDLTKHLLGPT